MNKENRSKNKRSEMNYAAIDIGSNAVRLLIKHINEKFRKKILKSIVASCTSSFRIRCLF